MRTLRVSMSVALVIAACCAAPAPATAWSEPLWVRQLDAGAYTAARGVATDAAGNIYLVGLTSGSLGGINRGANDAWLAKYDSAGRKLWTRQFGTESSDWASGVATKADLGSAASIYLIGNTLGSLGGRNRGGTDAWIAKYDTAGRKLWTRQLGTVGYDSASGLATDAAGNAYLAGETNGSLGGANRGSSDAWLAKLNGAGHVLWKRQLGTREADGADAVAADQTGNIYVVGSTFGALGGPNRGSFDAWLAKYDSAGHVLWKRQLGTETGDIAHAVASDAAGNVYVTGHTGGSLAEPNRGDADAWLAKYDPAGRKLWVRQFGTTTADSARGLATDAGGNVYLAGATVGARRGYHDAWLVKYDAAGNVRWMRQPRLMGADFAWDVATDALGSVYLAGETNEPLGETENRAWVVKYSTRR